LRLERFIADGSSGARRNRLKDATPPRRQKRQACLLSAFDPWKAMSAILLTGLLSAFLSFSGLAAMGQPATEPAGKLRTLTTTHQAHNLSSEETKRAYPVHLRGVVTYYDPSIGSHRAALFIHDATGTIYVEAAKGLIGDLSPGTLIEVNGVTGPGEFGPIVAHPQIKVIGRSALPANPTRPSLSLMKTGILDSQWIEVEGTIHSVAEFRHNLILQLEMEGGIASVVLVKEAGANYSALVDAKVRIRANASPTFNTSLQMIGVRLMCPGLTAITILEASPNDPYALPITQVNKLLRWDQVSDSLHRVHLRGRVTLQWPGSSLCIRDATRGICVQTAQETLVAEGDDVDVVGFVAAENSSPTLTDAVFRRISSDMPLAAVPITTEQALLGKFDSELIQIDGQLIGRDMEASDFALLISTRGGIFTAIVSKKMAGLQADTWKVGSTLRVTGICSDQLDAQKSAIGEGMAVPKSFRVLMRSPRDVVILIKPSWWTPAHALVILAFVLAGTLLALGWVIVLRKHVEQQAILLRESEQRFRHMALHDALTGLATRLLLQDRLNTAVETAKRHRRGLALLMVDLDKFKEINDTFGHHIGDEVLRVTALRLLEAVRKTDTVARMGGDEFVVLLPEINDPQAAELIAAKIVEAMAVPMLIEGCEVLASVSVGLCTAFAAEFEAEALLKNADAALYQAKSSGRNCLKVYSLDTASPPIE
jgi:diguanylate cyclase (GGDEF)-like protein